MSIWYLRNEEPHRFLGFVVLPRARLGTRSTIGIRGGVFNCQLSGRRGILLKVSVFAVRASLD
jgi:hypothetical protein